MPFWKTSLRLSVGGVGAKDIIKPLFSLLKGNGRQRGNGNGGREGGQLHSQMKSRRRREETNFWFRFSTQVSSNGENIWKSDFWLSKKQENIRIRKKNPSGRFLVEVATAHPTVLYNRRPGRSSSPPAHSRLPRRDTIELVLEEGRKAKKLGRWGQRWMRRSKDFHQ